MFKVGDRVRLKEPYGGCATGTEFTVSRLEKSYGYNNYDEKPYETIVHCRGPSGISCFDYRLELVTAAEPTDKELADEYRKNYLRQREIRKTLEERGYTSMMNGRAAPPMPEEASTLTFEKKIVEEI